jgi:two-component system, NtrC family, sensor histidine kinase GlrK
VSIALALTLLALTRMTGILQEVTDVELHSLRLEARVHHATWLVDISLGHAYSACRAGTATESVHEEISRSAETLRRELDEGPDIIPELPRMAEQWQALAQKVGNLANCDIVGSESFRKQRDLLDDELTDMWSQRLSVLHAGVAEKEAAARAIGGKALRVGGAISILAALVATFLARHLAKTLSQPLARLAAMARRVGTGDFSKQIRVRGPSEIETLAHEFERMREELAQLEQLKQGFLASVSHELRTPLSKLREALALLDDGVVGDLTPEQKRVLFIARAAAEREIRMVSTLLHLSRLRAGSPIRPRTGRILDEIIHRAVADELAELSEREVKVDLDLKGPPPVCHIDAELLERSVANLVRNALSVSQNGQTVKVSREELWQENGKDGLVRITVADEGPGVPADIQDTVFNAFVTSAVPRSPKALGIGLGLALAREVALAHGGDLILDTSVPRGATFHLLLPMAKARQRNPKSIKTAALLLENPLQ